MAWSEPPAQPPAPYELLDDGFPPEPCDLLIIGCGNILRGDDAVGPVLVRHLVHEGLPSGVRVVDGGTAGLDVAFAMRGAARVVIVDASATGAAPGTIFRVPAEELGDPPPMDGLHTHNLRWDHALSFGAWLLGPTRPTDVTVYLVEGEGYEPGAPLTERVEDAMHAVARLIARDHMPPPATIDITAAGYLRMSAVLAARHFPDDGLLARFEKLPRPALVLVPVHSPHHGGLVLNQSTPGGDRSVLIHQVRGFEPVAGTFDVSGDDDRGVLVVDLHALAVPPEGGSDGEPGGARGRDGGRRRAGYLERLPDRDNGGGGGTAAPPDPPFRAAGPTGGRRVVSRGRAAPGPAGGFR